MARRVDPASGLEDAASGRARSIAPRLREHLCVLARAELDRSSYLVSLDDEAAVRAVLARYQGVRFGREKALAARGLLSAGAIGLIARDTTYVAQRPAL